MTNLHIQELDHQIKKDKERFGYNVNIHLPCGTNDEKILEIYRTKLFEQAIKFKPDFVLISAGLTAEKETL